MFLAFTIPAVVGAVATGVSGAISSNKQRKSERTAQAQTRRDYRDSRGEGGNPVYLPLYSGSSEQDMFRDAMAGYLASRGAGAGANILENAAQLEQFNPALQAGNQFIIDAATGAMTNQRVSEAAPVFSARKNLALGQKQGILEGLEQSLNELRASQARGGFMGSSPVARNQALAQTIRARQDASRAIGESELANALQEQAIREAGRSLQLQTINAPFERGAANLAFRSLPGDYEAQRLMRAQQPLQFFKLPPGSPPGTNPITPSQSFGQVGLGVLGAGANAYAGIQADQYATDQLLKGLQAYRTQPSMFTQDSNWPNV